MKRILFLLFVAPLFTLAQNKPLLVQGAAPDLYLTHTVAPKENYYSIGRMYNISPKEIAPYNKLVLGKGLSLNQVIKIPLTTNFSQTNNAAADELMVPVYHTVKEKEGLYRIAANYNKLPLETLKKWNNIKGDAVSNGTKLIVGYLKVKKDLSSLSGMAKPGATVASKTNPVKEATKPDISNETYPAVKNPEKEKKPVLRPVKEKELPVVKKEEKAMAEETTTVKKVPPAVVVKETEPVKQVPYGNGKNYNGGFFKNDFNKQTKTGEVSNEAGNAAVFKSTSGWEDGKYYCLHNTAAPGSIIKITSTATGKSIYAKVLDVMPDIKQNTDILIRLSNAAAAELAVGEKFDCTLNFSK